jgi:flagellar motor protein MotB
VLSLPEQLAQAGLAVGKTAESDEALQCCDVSRENDALVIQIAGSAAFDKGSAAIRPQARAAIDRLAAMMKSGKARIEVRGHNGDGLPPLTSLYRDGLDLSFARARGVVEALAADGVDGKRMFVTACGDQQPLVLQAAEGSVGATNRRIEIVVHPTQVLKGNDQYAEKGQQNAR